MAVVLVHQGPSLTQETYEEVVRKLTGGANRTDPPGDGLLCLRHFHTSYGRVFG